MVLLSARRVTRSGQGMAGAGGSCGLGPQPTDGFSHVPDIPMVGRRQGGSEMERTKEKVQADAVLKAMWRRCATEALGLMEEQGKTTEQVLSDQVKATMSNNFRTFEAHLDKSMHKIERKTDKKVAWRECVLS